MEYYLEKPLDQRIKILTEAAKFDVSCSSSNSDRSAASGNLGNCQLSGVCHSFTADGRCISLLKLLMTNHCQFDCAYCLNRRTANIERARLTAEEICRLVMGFYRRNYIEGLFLSSAVEVSPDHTMQLLVDTLSMLRNTYRFNGYIHVKAIPGASDSLITAAAALADRMSVNLELPSQQSLALLAPQKNTPMLLSPMNKLSQMAHANQGVPRRQVKNIPAGQTTQMIIGASQDSDSQIVRLTEALYSKLRLKRVYYSAFTPVTVDSRLPALPPDLRRENRLYQADWLMRFYGFTASELLPEGANLALDIDPKSSWALNNIGRFPLEVNTADYDSLLKVPGIGVKNAYRIIEARRHSRLTFDSLKRMRVALTRAQYFITADGKYMGIGDKPELIRLRLLGKTEGGFTQLSIFDNDLTKNGADFNSESDFFDNFKGDEFGSYLEKKQQTLPLLQPVETVFSKGEKA